MYIPNRKLLEFIAGHGDYWIKGQGIWTYPNGDERQRDIYDTCVALEQTGWLKSRPRPDGYENTKHRCIIFEVTQKYLDLLGMDHK